MSNKATDKSETANVPKEVAEALTRMVRDSDFAVRYLEDMVTVWFWLITQEKKRGELKLMEEQIKMAAGFRLLFKSLAERWARSGATTVVGLTTKKEGQ